MPSPDSTGSQHSTRMERFVWDLTYACPLRCIHCSTDSGRRPARMLDRTRMREVVDVILSVKPQRISLAGGEPLSVPWWHEAAEMLNAGGVAVTVFTSGWLMNDKIAEQLAQSVTAVTVSVDGANAQIHDKIRGRAGSFDRAMAALERLSALKLQRTARGEKCYELGMDCTVTRTGKDGLETLVEEVTRRVPGLDYVRIGAVMPVGLAQEKKFEAEELLNDTELEELIGSQPALKARAANGVEVSVTDVRLFLPTSPLADESATIAMIEPDGDLRAFGIYEAKVGNVLQEPIDTLWERALAWRQEPFVRDTLNSVHTFNDWAAATRALDRRYGSDADKARLAKRTAVS